MKKIMILAALAMAVTASVAAEITFYVSGAPQKTMTLDKRTPQEQLVPTGLALPPPVCTPHSEDKTNRCLEDVAKSPLLPSVKISYLGSVERDVLLGVTEDSCEGLSVSKGPDDPKTGNAQFLLMPAACKIVSLKVKLSDDGKLVPLTFKDSSTKFLGDYALSARSAKP